MGVRQHWLQLSDDGSSGVGSVDTGYGPWQPSTVVGGGQGPSPLTPFPLLPTYSAGDAREEVEVGRVHRVVTMEAKEFVHHEVLRRKSESVCVCVCARACRSGLPRIERGVRPRPSSPSHLKPPHDRWVGVEEERLEPHLKHRPKEAVPPLAMDQVDVVVPGVVGRGGVGGGGGQGG